mmetsp:Transcript_24544/g.54643  ORF Transcript_24544/g.54643 Transcript_24544/m.54643 type:complete len:206 (-) Transcript_24544:112-729(-)|eukprot:CAMPEP_0170615062 /NCGR_PEP_ID=MMETSP0224-20130122/25133_1 /TAXON_ID=285029 /ORGANISM="Togula jolla, Strain CCCM 725" /LENGTH=205 /DNA_ID=CAMNT_0010940761 /DNA_START=73 /DNA_END=690 /DNA_ORIENTATION=+
MTNYNKWDKFVSDIPSDTESEEERELSDFTKKSVRYIHIPPVEFTTKPQLCKLLEEDPNFAPPSSAAAGIVIEGEELETGTKYATSKYGWSSVGSQLIPGYGAGSKGSDHWRIFFDDNFLSTQKVPNRGARALLGHNSLGSFVVACLNRDTGEDRPISRKEVADLIISRQQGNDAERIALERERHEASMKTFEAIGAERVDLKPN